MGGYVSEEAHRAPKMESYSFSDPPEAVNFTNACEWQRGVWVELDEAKGFPAIPT